MRKWILPTSTWAWKQILLQLSPSWDHSPDWIMRFSSLAVRMHIISGLLWAMSIVFNHLRWFFLWSWEFHNIHELFCPQMNTQLGPSADIEFFLSAAFFLFSFFFTGFLSPHLEFYLHLLNSTGLLVFPWIPLPYIRAKKLKAKSWDNQKVHPL